MLNENVYYLNKVTCRRCPFQVMYASAVRVENGRNMEGRVPDIK